MTTLIKTIIDRNGDTILPRTTIEAVYLEDNATPLSTLIGSAFLYKGEVANFAALPLIKKIGDLYLVIDEAIHYFYNGATWQVLATKAAATTVEDSGTYYASSDVEGVLQEVGAKTVALESFAIAMAIGLS